MPTRFIVEMKWWVQPSFTGTAEEKRVLNIPLNRMKTTNSWFLIFHRMQVIKVDKNLLMFEKIYKIFLCSTVSLIRYLKHCSRSNHSVLRLCKSKSKVCFSMAKSSTYGKQKPNSIHIGYCTSDCTQPRNNSILVFHPIYLYGNKMITWPLTEPTG